MESKGRCVWFLLVVAVVVAAGVETVRGAGECGRVPVDQVALKLAPCAAATQNPRAAVLPNCCAQFAKFFEIQRVHVYNASDLHFSSLLGSGAKIREYKEHILRSKRARPN
uniref:Bifunctional inhibitor/plant lipid transfer protein/seed storage helical domain-containing protein n=1 Tax=Oryza glumipatula TaxID=40148 RepID=A0A0D9YHB5_9ORYZ